MTNPKHGRMARSTLLTPDSPLRPLLRIFALWGATTGVLFVINNYLIFWQGWPGILDLFAYYGVPGMGDPSRPLQGNAVSLGWLQLLLNAAPLAALVFWVVRTPNRPMQSDSDALAGLAAYIIRSSFWAVLLIGLADGTISFLRVEGMLPDLFGHDMADQLSRARYRGLTIHYPLLGLGFVIGAFTRSLGFTWLAVLIVLAEFQIVITRFIFSYEQAFMGDLVRFWYAALFLFASAYTLMEEGHVRVDILYNTFSERGKAWANAIGTLLLGVPVCWVILTRGMWGKSNLINAPLLSYEVTQSGYGLYVKYLMAGFLLIYALSMLIQFFSFFLENMGKVLHEPEAEAHHHPDHPAEV